MLTHEKRILASFIDISIVLVLSLLVNIFIPNTMFNSDLTFSILYLIIGFTYTFLCLIISKDRTIGLYSMSLRLLSDGWDKPSLKIITLRSLVHGVPVLYLVNILYMLLNKTDNTFFDELTGSFVAKTGDVYNVSINNQNENKL